MKNIVDMLAENTTGSSVRGIEKRNDAIEAEIKEDTAKETLDEPHQLIYQQNTL